MNDVTASIIIRVICNTNTTLCAGCPTTAAISPPTGPFSAGDILTCSADGYPEPSYEWIDGRGWIVSSKSTVTVPEGPFNLTCRATGDLPGSCSASDSVSGTAKSKYRKQHTIHVHVLTNVHMNSMLFTFPAIECDCNVHSMPLVP